MPTSITGKTSKKARINSGPAGRPAGFSLIELMIVLVIMAVVMGMAGPRIARNMGLLHLRTAAKQVASSLRWTRSQALSTGKVYNAIFDCGKQRLLVSDYAGSMGVDPLQLLRAQAGMLNDSERQLMDQELQEEQRKPVLKIFELPDEVSFSRVDIGEVHDLDPGEGRIYQMTFFPDGTSIGGEITMSDEQRRACVIAVDFLTGIVSLEESES